MHPWNREWMYCKHAIGIFPQRLTKYPHIDKHIEFKFIINRTGNTRTNKRAVTWRGRTTSDQKPGKFPLLHAPLLAHSTPGNAFLHLCSIDDLYGILVILTYWCWPLVTLDPLTRGVCLLHTVGFDVRAIGFVLSVFHWLPDSCKFSTAIRACSVCLYFLLSFINVVDISWRVANLDDVD